MVLKTIEVTEFKQNFTKIIVAAVDYFPYPESDHREASLDRRKTNSVLRV